MKQNFKFLIHEEALTDNKVKPKEEERKDCILLIMTATTIIVFITSFDESCLLGIFMKNSFGIFRFLIFLIPLFFTLKIFKKTINDIKSELIDEGFIKINEISKNNRPRNKNIFDIEIGYDLKNKKKFYYDFRETHTLIGGVSRYGKSTTLNTLIYGLSKINPKKARIIIADFKQVDFVLFEDLPHLLTDLITDKESFKNLLQWLVKETDNRFKIIRQAKVRNIKTYNQISSKKMPYIFFISDEYLKMLSYFSSSEKKEITNNINALISTSAGCGIILFLTTQRPDSKVIDSRIKANLSNRIAFHCADEANSKIILDESGAELLQNKGEMIFKTDFGKKHIQGTLIDDIEIINQIRDVSSKYSLERISFSKTNIDNNNLIQFERKKQISNVQFQNELTERAITKSLEDRKEFISRTYLKKILKVGDRKADEVIQELVKINFISESDRKILVTYEEFEKKKDNVQ